MASPRVAEDGSGDRGEPDLELVDAGRVSARANLAQLRRQLRAPPKARKHFPLAASSNRDFAADPVGDADEVSGVLLRQVLDPVGPGNREVDRLAGNVGKPAKTRSRKLDERRRGVAVRVSEQNRPGPKPPAVLDPLNEPLPL